MAVLTEEQDMVRDSAQGWARDRSPIGELRRRRDSGDTLGFSAESWHEQCELGWPGVAIPESYGGSDFGYFAMGIILEEMGRTLTASPLLASALGAGCALLLGGTEGQKQQYLPRIADGSLIATLAVDEDARHAPDVVATTATPSGAKYRIDGRKWFVHEGPAAELLIVSALLADGVDEAGSIGLFLVPCADNGVEKCNLSLIDNRGAADITFSGAEAELLGEVGTGKAVLDAVLDRLRIGLTAEMLGASLQAFDITMEYLKARVQFGQPIGAFQALQHRAAEMFTQLELSRSAVEAALQAIDDDAADLPELASLAKAKLGDTLYLISNELIQMHGGIGMTDEHDAGFYLKRARACEAAFGNRSYHRERYGQLLGY